MSIQMKLWRVAGETLQQVPSATLNQEERLENWIEKDPAILGLELALVGRQVQTEFGGRIDLLAIDRQGSCVIIELKKGRSPRDVVAQLLDYASWVCDLDYDDLDRIASEHYGKNIASLYQEAFEDALPEQLNTTHSMVIAAAELDESSERIIGYLSEKHGLSINAVFFSFFSSDGAEHLGRAWLRDPIETIERAESRKRPPWSGLWFLNVGEGDNRNWDDNRRYGFIGAGQEEKYSKPLQNLHPGDKIFAYLKGLGYVGYGEVTKAAVPIRQFTVDVDGRPLLDHQLKAPNPSANADSHERSEWVVGVRWVKAMPREEAKTFKGIFANQNIVCKLRDPKTIEFLRSQFGLEGC
jgi:hypothetical protein